MLTACAAGPGSLDQPAISELWLSTVPVIAEALGGTELTDVDGQLTAAGEQPSEFALAGALDDAGDYELFSVGPSSAGDSWEIELIDGAGGVVVVLLDSEFNLLARTGRAGSQPLCHVLRYDSAPVYVGVTAAAGGSSFSLRVRHQSGFPVPAPRQQRVFLNFAGGQDICIHGRRGVTFPALDACVLGKRYAGATGQIKQAIADTVRQVYIEYDVIVSTSDEGPPPADPHSVIHFVGDGDNQLCGLADKVDPYNADPADSALVFVASFAAYQTMELAPEELGRMIGNTACHELGHLLGLYHTHDAENVMDVAAGSARDLAGPRRLERAALDPTVFPIGMLDIPRLLLDTVGPSTERLIDVAGS